LHYRVSIHLTLEQLAKAINPPHLRKIHAPSLLTPTPLTAQAHHVEPAQPAPPQHPAQPQHTAGAGSAAAPAPGASPPAAGPRGAGLSAVRPSFEGISPRTGGSPLVYEGRTPHANGYPLVCRRGRGAVCGVVTAVQGRAG